MFHFVCVGILTIVAVAVLLEFVIQYTKAPTLVAHAAPGVVPAAPDAPPPYAPGATLTTWQRALHAASGSATVLWSYFLIVIGWALSGVGDLATALNMPEVQSFVHNNLPAEWVGIAVAGIAVVTIIARLRTLA